MIAQAFFTPAQNALDQGSTTCGRTAAFDKCLCGRAQVIKNMGCGGRALIKSLRLNTL